jgi:hypothetical protein
MERHISAEGGVRHRSLSRLLHWFTVFLAVFLFALFLYAAVRRIGYPYEVEWIESNILVSVLRILHGQGIYVAPTLNYVPYLYAPLYLYASAAVTKLVGVGTHGYAGMRLVSIVATLGSCIAIYALVRTETRRRLPAIAAAGVFVGCYSVVGSFYDIGRVDSLFVFLLLCALLAQRRGHPIAAALLWVLTAQTKQTVLPLALLILCAEWQRPRRLLAALTTYIAAVTASIIVLNHATHGWYDFYIFHVAQGLPVVWRQVALYFPTTVLEPLAVAWMVIAAALLLTRPRLQSAGVMFYAFVSIALIGGVWFVEGHRGSSVNAMIPVYAWTAVMFGVALARLLDRAEQVNAPHLELLALTAAAMQLMVLIYNPGRYIPTRAQRAATDHFIAQLRSMPGDVYLIDHSYDAILAGKQPHAESQAMGAVLDAPTGAIGVQLRAEYAAAQREHRFSVVVSDSPQPADTIVNFDEFYPLAVSTGLSPYRYMTSQPQWFLLPCEEPLALTRSLESADSTIVPHGCDY